MKKLLFIASALVSFANTNFAQRKFKQPEIKRCYTHEKMMELRALNPDAYDKNQAKQEQILQNRIANNYNAKSQTIYTIPVVVQIFGAAANSAVTDNRVYEQIDVLTKDYRRLNSDTNQTPNDFKGIAADVEFEFCLATVDPQGNTTTGIVRKTGTSAPSQSDLWNTSNYLNLLVYNLGGSTLGYTYTPSTDPNNGVHISYQYFGKTGASSPFNKGRTATHEVGHWFNLEHIWADESQCSADDYVSDTPKQKAEYYGCPSYPQTAGRCNTSDPSTMFMNYMDYTDDGCMNIFSAGQKARMVAAINQYRPNVFNNGKCGNIATPPSAAFTANQTTITEGACVNFNDQSTGSPTSWSWTFQSGTPSSSTTQNPPNICFNDTGCYDVTLIVSNTDGSDTLVQTCYINVVPQGTQICDTVSNYKLTDTPSLIGSAGWGYVTGHNDYDDRAKADYFTAPPSGYEITGAKFWFAKTYAGSTSSTIDVNIWSDNGGTPDTILYSQTVPLNQLQVYPNETFINFITSQTVTGNYYLGIQIAPDGTPQDTVALMSNADGETNPGTGWELWSDTTWHPISELNTGWGINLSQAIWVIRCPADTGGTICNLSVTITTTNATCGQNDGSATAMVSGGTSPYSYLWSNGLSGASATGLSAGTYSVTITDADNCTATTMSSVNNSGAPTISISSTNCSSNGVCDGTASVMANGGTTPYSYLWSNGDTVANISNLCANTFSVTVTDGMGCASAASVIITEPNGIAKVPQDFGINIFPNPNNGQFIIRSQNLGKLKIYNVTGEIVYSKLLVTYNEQLATNFPPGIYFVEISTGEKTVVRKISVIK